MFELKPLSPEAFPRALAKAERYRLLNEPARPRASASTCSRRIPAIRQALVMLLLALTDQFPRHDGQRRARAQELACRGSPTSTSAPYYGGLVAERRAPALLGRGGPGRVGAGGRLAAGGHEAYERAEALRPPGNDDALLRWNACARLLQAASRAARTRRRAVRRR